MSWVAKIGVFGLFFRLFVEGSKLVFLGLFLTLFGELLKVIFLLSFDHFGVFDSFWAVLGVFYDSLVYPYKCLVPYFLLILVDRGVFRHFGDFGVFEPFWLILIIR